MKQTQKTKAMTTIKAYTKTFTYFNNNDERISNPTDNQKLAAAIYGKVEEREWLAAVVEDTNRKRAFEKLSIQLNDMGFEGTITRHQISI